MTEPQVTKIATSLVHAGVNDRTVFDVEKLYLLAESIRERGLDNPITVRRDGNGYEIVAGERRFRACAQILGWKEISAFVREMGDEDASLSMFAENFARSDLDPVDECKAYQKRMDQFGWDEAQLIEKMKTCGVSPERVKRRLKLAKVRADILHLVRSGQFPIGHAEAIAKLDENRQLIAAKPLIEGSPLPFHQFNKIVERLFEEQSSASLFDLALWGGELEKMPEAQMPSGLVLPDLDPRVPEMTFDPATPKHTGALMYHYYQCLLRDGHDREAGAILNAMHGLMVGYYIRLPNVMQPVT